MDVKLLAFLALWILTLLTGKSFCHVNCTTDFETSLNCSWSGIISPFPLLLEVECSDDDTNINGSCEIMSTKGWCSIEPDDFYLFASIGTYCTSRIMYAGKLHKTDSVEWELSHMVKPQQPIKVQVRANDEYYNVTWDIINQEHLDNKFMYRVRIRTKSGPLMAPIYYNPVEEERYVHIYSTTLRQQSIYVVDVQAKLSPESIYQGPWSEWSSTVEFVAEGGDTLRWYFFQPIVAVLCFLGAGYFIKQICSKNKKYIPKPDDFFKPLYHTYDGDFKKWVRPIFSESDHLVMNLTAQEMTEGQLEVIGSTCKMMEHISSEDNQGDRKQGSLSLLGPSPQSSSLLYFHGESGHGTGHSTGHISIHTVTVSGEQEVASAGSRDGMASELEDLLDCRIDREGELSMQGGRRSSSYPPSMEWPPQARDMEPEQISLDSFYSNEQSDDGYPRVDLDTFDSGFMESDCSSPMNSDFNAEEHMDSALLSGAGSSNYVKQWMICSTVEGEPDNLPQHSAAL